MRVQKQLNRHKPSEGIYGDCHRTAIASVLDMDAKDVPHFMDGLDGQEDAPQAHTAVEAWLNDRGITQITILFPGDLSISDILMTVKNTNPYSPGLVFILGGESRTGVNHSVVCCDGEIVCDPSRDDSGIIGPCNDGYYWLTFFGTLAAVHKPARETAAAL